MACTNKEHTIAEEEAMHKLIQPWPLGGVRILHVTLMQFSKHTQRQHETLRKREQLQQWEGSGNS